MNLPKLFCYVSDIDSSIAQDMRYAGNNNFLGRPATGYEKPIPIMTTAAAQALKAAQSEFMKLGYSILIYDAYRPQMAVDDFWNWANDVGDIKMKNIYYPDYADKTKLFSDGFIARLSKHSRGSTTDITLIDLKTCQPIDMGGIFDYFGPISFSECKDISSQAQLNRQLLRNTMLKFGFQGYSKEWWHYELIDEPFPKKPEDHFNFRVE